MRLARILDWLVQRWRFLAVLALVTMALLVVADFATEPSYQRYPWDGLGGFGALYGFASCVVIIIVSKALGYAFLYRSDDYYDDEQRHDD